MLVLTCEWLCVFVVIHVMVYTQDVKLIRSFARNFNRGFEPDYEVINNSF